jgi:hypothetical protein
LTIEPRTEAGRYFRRLLRAGVLRDIRDPGNLLEQDDTAAELAVAGRVFDAIVGLLVARRFPRGTDVRELHRYVTTIRDGLEPDEVLPARETEAYLRARLGEPYLLAEVDPARLGEPLGHLLLQLTQEVPLAETDIDELVVEAEGIAVRLDEGRVVTTGSWPVLAAGAAEVPESRVVDWSAIARPKASRWGRAEAPRTRPGRYVRVAVLPDKATRDELSAQMRGTPEMSTAIAIMRELGRDVLRSAFPAPADLRRVTATLAHVRAGFRATHLSLLEMDAVARADLGEEAFTEGIPVAVRHTTRGVLVSAVIQEVPFAAREVDALVAAAERRVPEEPHG